jgi:type IV conjugative transfer system coupling protein TraD
MKPKYGDFTRGSQLIETFGMMFAAGLRPMLWVIGTVFSVSLGFLIWNDMESGDLYRCAMRFYSWFWDYLKLNPGKLVNVVGPGNTPVRIPVGQVPEYPPVQQSWQLLITTVTAAFQFTAIVALPVCFFYTWASRWIGRRVLRRNHERGATIAPVAELVDLIDARNSEKSKAEREEEYLRVFGPYWRLKAPLAKKEELLAAGVYEPYTIAGVPYPWRTEQTHMFSVGTTGTGKSTMMRDLLDQVRKRGKKAVVFDLTGTFIEGFYDPTRDVILNPFDERCPQWSVFNDCTTRAEFTSAAEALIPSDGGGAEPFWVQAARLLFVEACVRLSELGLTTNRHLYEELMTASLKEVNALVGGTVASPLSDPQAARMAESIRATMNTNINAIRSLPIEGEQFSIKQWVHAEHEGGSVLFIAARHVDLSTVKVLLTLWMDMTINAMMAGTPSPRDVRIWFLFDELGALHRLPAIEKGMQTARNYGGAFVLGVHTIAKLRDTYGDDIAETLGSLARTKLILATADYTSAKWCSDQIGNGEWSEMEQGISFGVDNVRDAVTLTNKRQLEPLVLPDDISKLPDLTGWLVFPQGFPASKIRLKIRNWPKKAHGFIQRPDISQPLKTLVVKRPKGGDDSGVGITLEAQQVLRLPVQFDPEKTAETPESDTAKYERLNAEWRRDRTQAADQKSQAERGVGDDKHALRTPRETPEKNDSQDAPGVTIQGTATTIPDAGETRPTKKSLEEQRGSEDLTKREARSNFNQGRDEPEEDLEMDR